MSEANIHHAANLNQRAVPMEILVLGLCRTGTQSLADALELLGYQGVYHMREVHKNNHGSYWIAALEAKYEGKQEAFKRKDFDNFLGHFMAVSDTPAAAFPDELISAYPEAKVILTTRDENKWFESMKATVWHLYESRKAAGQSDVKFHLLELQQQHIWGWDPDKFGRERYREHNEHVRIIAPKDKFLEYQVQQGWEPLCKFLGKEIPEVDFPRADAWVEYKQMYGSKG